jgi:hypothetical protein
LNGWQRLFVVAAVLWAVAVAYYMATHFPSRTYMKDAWTSLILGDASRGAEVYLETGKTKEDWLKEYPDFDRRLVAIEKTLSAAVAEAHKTGPHFVPDNEASIEFRLATVRDAREDMANLLSYQIKRLATAVFVWWLCPVIAVYVAGWTCVWVRRGFTDDRRTS